MIHANKNSQMNILEALELIFCLLENNEILPKNRRKFLFIEIVYERANGSLEEESKERLEFKI